MCRYHIFYLLWIAAILTLLLFDGNVAAFHYPVSRVGGFYGSGTVRSLGSSADPQRRLARSLRKVADIRAGSSASSGTELAALPSAWLNIATGTPVNLFNTLLLGLGSASLLWKIIEAKRQSGSSTAADNDPNSEKPEAVKSLQARFLIVFWLLRMADWLQGPYFYEVYSSKIFNGVPASLELVSRLFLVGFASTGIFGPWIGRFVDSVGRRAGTLAFALMYTIGALSTRSSQLWTLLMGRLAGGIGTSLLFSAPEAWLVGEHQKSGFDGKWLGQTFGLAYAGDAIVAITAGQLASLTAAREGPSGPFTLSVVFLALGALIALLKWDENVAVSSTASSDSDSSSGSGGDASKQRKPSIRDAVDLMAKDPRILFLGAVQALFEGSMYIFVLQWPPAMIAAIQSSAKYAGAATPFGNIFSCFMASCLLGSTIFGSLQARNISVEKAAFAMLMLATASMATATVVGSSSLALLTAAMFLFEVCVGMYFPSIGTLRSKYLPDSHRSVMMNLFGIPLNLIVVTVFLSIRSLGVQGALAVASAALGIATVCMGLLSRSSNSSNQAET